MPHLIAVANQKGGSGKTTTAVNLAAALAETGAQVLVIDMDAQGSATRWLHGDNVDNDIYDALTDNYDVTDVIINTSVEGVHLAPASDWMVRLDKELAGEMAAETTLRQRMGDLGAYDFVLMDCSPALGIATINALVAADSVLVPVEASYMAVSGLAQLMKTIDKVRESGLNPDLSIIGVLACRVDRRTIHATEAVELLREHLDQTVFDTIIRENVRLKEAPSYHQAITAYDTNSAGAEDYRSLARELTKKAHHA